MSYLTQPVAVTGAVITLANPGANQNSSAPVAVQIRNASAYVLNVLSAGPQALVDPFTAVTVPISTGGNVILTPGLLAYPNLGSDGYVSAEWLISNELPSEHDGALTAAATAATIAGSVTANQPQTQLTNSPLTASGPGTTTFTWPNNTGPFSSVLLVLTGVAPGCTANFCPVNLTVTGATTGAVYLAEVIDHGVWRLDISSLVEPAGVTVDYQLPYGYVPANWNPVFNVVGMVSPEIVRPAYGPGVSGPTDTNSAGPLYSQTAPFSDVLAGVGSKTGTIRLWSAWLSMAIEAIGANTNITSSIAIATGTKLLSIVMAGTTVTSGISANNSISFPGGLPLSISTTEIVLEIDNNAAVGAWAMGGISYSWDSQ